MRVALQDHGTFKTFPEAFLIFYREIKKMVDEGTSWQVLETACFMEFLGVIVGQSVRFPIGWYDARDLAHKVGLTDKKCHFIDAAPVVEESVIHARIVELMEEHVQSAIDESIELLEKAAAASDDLLPPPQRH